MHDRGWSQRTFAELIDHGLLLLSKLGWMEDQFAESARLEAAIRDNP
jgi:hypothetical protein